MIPARIDGPRVTCGRPGCADKLGTMDSWVKVDWALGLSRHWFWDDARKPARWRKGSHHRRHSRLGSGYDAPAKVLGGPRGMRWQVALPTVIECPRCATVQSVEKPLADGRA